jgi:hypothetical protein
MDFIYSFISSFIVLYACDDVNKGLLCQFI